jgi:enamine deaminase RidA (YjgF/YER057c/UK114 family)
LAPTVSEQIRTVLDHIEEALETAGTKPEDVYKVLSYHVDIGSVGELSKGWMERWDTKPTWTAVVVRELAAPGAQVEVQIEAWGSGCINSGPEDRGFDHFVIGTRGAS